MQIDEFPNDDSLWLIKLIDGFQLPRLRTRSPSVYVLLQRLPEKDPRALHRMTAEKVEECFARKGETDDWQKVPILAGYLPYLAIGMVFRKKEYVGQLPARLHNISLRDTDETCKQVSFQDLVTPPPGWNSDYPYRTINPSEYSGLRPNGFYQSQCVVHQTEETQFIIPRSVIFRSFYGLTARMVNAFCKGPWESTSHELVYFGAMESGLETKENKEKGSWDIILQPKVKIEYAPILAILLFDPFARQCADAIYARALQERGSNIVGVWHSSAQIPFDTSVAGLTLQVKGYKLKHGWSTSPRKILVTGIVAFSFEAAFPRIRWEKFNSGAQGQEVHPVEEPTPYQKDTYTSPAPDDTIAVSDEDIDANAGAFSIFAEDINWINPPIMEKLPKVRSKQYQKEKHGHQATDTGDQLSAGTPTYQQSGLTEAQIETLVRDPGKRFEHILDAFDDLKRDGHIDSYTVFGPSERSLLATRGGLPCWNFLDESSRKSGVWPRRGWRLVEFPNPEIPKSLGLPRCALVLRVKMGNIVGYWVEIELRSHSTEGFRSPFIITEEEPHEAIAHFVDLIAVNSGINLEKKLADEARKLTNTRAPCYKHHYRSRDDPSLDRQSIRRFLGQ